MLEAVAAAVVQAVAEVPLPTVEVQVVLLLAAEMHSLTAAQTEPLIQVAAVVAVVIQIMLTVDRKHHLALRAALVLSSLAILALSNL